MTCKTKVFLKGCSRPVLASEIDERVSGLPTSLVREKSIVWKNREEQKNNRCSHMSLTNNVELEVWITLETC